MYKEFGFTDVFVKFSDRPEQRVGSDQIWDAAEEALRVACKKQSLIDIESRRRHFADL